ncbi:MAG: hypothetical protein JRF33_05105 [Deltaproteobacteria bacterium]|nr:hypothetical protein [Deltaproteobacteria bacterium]
MKSKFLFLLALPSLLWACSTNQDPCQVDTCAPHGTCVAENGAPSCVCDEFYQPGPDLSCILETGLLMGQHCIDDADCLSDKCQKYTGDPEGYCTTTDCLWDEDCRQQAPPEHQSWCCVEIHLDTFLCLMIAEGYSCSSPAGLCGLSCSDNPNICSPASPCMGDGPDDPKAICSATCATDADCSACEWSVDPDAPIACVTISGSDKYCLVNQEAGCTSHMDCPEGESCTIGVSPDMTDLFGECMNVGALPPGSECNDEDDPNNLSYEERCSGFYCFGGMCSEVCVTDTDCPEGMSCLEHTFEQVDDSIMVCVGGS